jgi:hypothetical protein
MSSRRLRLHVLCEDEVHRQFIERLADRFGIGPRQRQINASPNSVAADAYVLQNYAEAVSLWRAERHDANVGLLVVIDGDTRGVARRRQDLAKKLKDAGMDPIALADPVAILVPTWHIETWIGWLSGHRPVDEQTRYKVDRGALPPAAHEMARKIKNGDYTPRGAVQKWTPSKPGEEEQVPSLSDARREIKARLGV